CSVDADVVADDDEDKTVLGFVHVDHVKGQFSYRLDWRKWESDRVAKGPRKRSNNLTTAPTDKPYNIQEFGLAFDAPPSADHFSWDRKAFWTWYPSDHIGRPRGTATPDSANVSNANLSRVDAFDFNSTKYDCNYATPT